MYRQGSLVIPLCLILYFPFSHRSHLYDFCVLPTCSLLTSELNMGVTGAHLHKYTHGLSVDTSRCLSSIPVCSATAPASWKQKSARVSIICNNNLSIDSPTNTFLDVPTRPHYNSSAMGMGLPVSLSLGDGRSAPEMCLHHYFRESLLFICASVCDQLVSTGQCGRSAAPPTPYSVLLGPLPFPFCFLPGLQCLCVCLGCRLLIRFAVPDVNSLP